jgi:hypothetical protein
MCSLPQRNLLHHDRVVYAGGVSFHAAAGRRLRVLLRLYIGDGHYSCLTMSTEISTAGIVPLFSSQCVVFLSSGQPTPGP